MVRNAVSATCNIPWTLTNPRLTSGQILQQGEHDEIMVVGLELDGRHLVDDHFFEVPAAEQLGMHVLKLLELGRRGSLFAVVLIVANEEGADGLPKLSLNFVHPFNIIIIRQV